MHNKSTPFVTPTHSAVLTPPDPRPDDIAIPLTPQEIGFMQGVLAMVFQRTGASMVESLEDRLELYMLIARDRKGSDNE